VSTSRRPLSDSYEGLLGRARAAYQAGDVEGAVALYRRLVERLGRLGDGVLARRPELPAIRLQATGELVALLRQEGRLAEAIELVEGLVRTDPDQAEYWRRNLAVLRLAKGEIEPGLNELRALTKEHPDQARNWIVLGDESRVEGRFAESQAAFDRALELLEQGEQDDLWIVYFSRFFLYRDMGRLDEAVAAWEQAVALNAQVSGMVREVYTMLTDAGRYSEAQRYVARDENALQAGFQRGLLASLRGNRAQAREEWQAVADLDPGDFAGGQDCWVESVLRLGDPEPALEGLQGLFEQDRPTPRLLILSGIAWAMYGDSEVASALFQRAIDLQRWARPPKQKLDSADWRLLDSLVADDEIKITLKPFFAVIETIWG
jgi:tetratricopeptide (TPR) repeat protein